MKKSMAKVLAGALSLAMAVTLVTPSNAAAASKPKFSKTYSNVYSGTSAAYTVKNVKKGYTVKVSVTGTAKKAVKLSKSKINVTKTTAKFTAKVTASASTANKGATVTAVVYDKKGKKVKTLKDGIRIKAHATAVAVSAADTKTAIGQAVALTTTLTPAYATDAVSYTVDPADGATVADGKFTATKEGTYKVTATANGRTSEPVEIVVTNGIVSATQTASNSFKATFAADASKTVSTGSITVKANDAAKTELQVKDVKFSADGKEAEVTLLNNLTDKATYTVTANGSSAEFTANIGAVAKIVIETATAEVNTATDIKFNLFDANGIDVTSTVNVDANCYVTAEGDYTDVSLGTPSKATITFGEVGKKATVKVVYNSNEKDAVDVVGTQEITCAAATAKVGTALFTTSDKKNNKSDCAKFYLGLSDKDVTVFKGNSKDVYFCATDNSGKVISYDSYEVTSSNDNVVTSSVTKDSGKFAKITVDASEKGSAVLTVKATKNDASTTYTIPVTAKEVGKAVKMELTTDNRTLSNADDEGYYSTIKAKLLDADGNKVDGTFEVRVSNNPKECSDFGAAPVVNDPTAPDDAIALSTNSKVSDNELEIKAYASRVTRKVNGKSFTIQIKGSDNNSDQIVTRSTSITVKALPLQTSKVEYSVDVDKKLDLNPDKRDDEKATVKLKATVNGLFAGYYGNKKATDGSKNDITNGEFGKDEKTGLPIALTGKNKVATASAIVKFGNQEFESVTGNENGDLVVPKASAKPVSVPATFDAVRVSTGSSVNAYDIKGLKDTDAAYAEAGFARTGTYTAHVYVTFEGESKSVDKTATFSIVNTMTVPKVEVSTSSVSSLDFETIKKEALTTNVDMNNDTSDYESILNILQDKYKDAESKGNKMIIKYVEVVDNYGSYDYHFMVPVSRNFTEK